MTGDEWYIPIPGIFPVANATAAMSALSRSPAAFTGIHDDNARYTAAGVLAAIFTTACWTRIGRGKLTVVARLTS